MATLKFDDHKVPYLDLGSGYRIALESNEYTDAISKEKAARELRETPDVVEKSIQELRSLLQEEKSLYIPMDNDAFMIKFLRPCKYYAKSAFELIQRYYRFRSKHPDLCDELFPASVTHVYAEGLVHFLPLRDQHNSRILVLECGMWSFFTQKKHSVDIASEGYHMFPNTRISGVFTLRTPGYLVHDPVLYKQMAIKDFDHFTDHVTQLSLEADPILARSLFFTNGARWRHHRPGLSPAFTGSKMRNMFGLLSKMDSLTDRENEFFLKGKRLAKLDGLPGLKFLISTIIPGVFQFFKMDIVYEDVNEFYLEAVSRSIRLREDNNITRPDFIHLLLQARKNTLKSEKIEDDSENVGISTTEPNTAQITNGYKMEWEDVDITGAAVSFFFGGIETTTTLLCFACYELAVNPSIQARLRAEIDAARDELEDGITPSYELLQKLKYMDMVVSETLRRWTPFGLTNRKCTKDYTFTNTDGTRVTIEKGMNISIPLQAFHQDEKYFPDPLRFDPERFADPASINQDAYVPFGSGLRNCIGLRLALMQAKCILFYIFSNFVLEPSPKQTIPLEIDESYAGLNAKHGFWMVLTPRML
uniref:CRAL/TRIO N-terminal domain-containing protein n=1 Tax=Anopheles atroparvus TaxID=41427 RepID=A0A182JFZ5_ANOAO